VFRTRSESRSTLERAIEIAIDAHAGQKGRSGEAYVLHPLRVMFRLANEDERIAGVLHDVVERAPDWTLRRLAKNGFPPEIVAAIDALSRREGERYEDYILRASRNQLARRVKIADLEDKLTSAQADGRTKKYGRALSVLRRRR
jgi:(p)ppGpp synthase/HD superfamily hydrolase